MMRDIPWLWESLGSSTTSAPAPSSPMTDPSSSFTNTSCPVVFLSIPGLGLGGAKPEDVCVGVVDALAGDPKLAAVFVASSLDDLLRGVFCAGVKLEDC